MVSSKNIRERLLVALAESVEELGWEQTTTAEIARRAKTSKRSFYQEFRSREDAFACLYQKEAGQLQAAVLLAVVPLDEPAARIEAGLTAYVSHFSTRPQLLRAMLLGTFRQGEQGIQLRRSSQAAFVGLMSQMMVQAGIPESQASALARVYVGGANDMLLEAVENPNRPKFEQMEQQLRQVLSFVLALAST